MSIDLPKLSSGVPEAVAQRGLFLIATYEPPPTAGIYIYVCTSPEPRAFGRTKVGFVVREGGPSTPNADSLLREVNPPHIVYAMNGEQGMYEAALRQIRGYFPTWEQGILTVLEGFDQWGRRPRQ